jgi:hypothetical protein
MIAAISVVGLRKSFGQTQALDDLDLTVDTGEVHGFLGPNGECWILPTGSTLTETASCLVRRHVRDPTRRAVSWSAWPRTRCKRRRRFATRTEPGACIG